MYKYNLSSFLKPPKPRLKRNKQRLASTGRTCYPGLRRLEAHWPAGNGIEHGSYSIVGGIYLFIHIYIYISISTGVIILIIHLCIPC